jgi:hypothetical protein
LLLVAELLWFDMLKPAARIDVRERKGCGE